MRIVDAACTVEIARGFVAVVEEERLPIAGDEWLHGMIGVVSDHDRLRRAETGAERKGGDDMLYGRSTAEIFGLA